MPALGVPYGVRSVAREVPTWLPQREQDRGRVALLNDFESERYPAGGVLLRVADFLQLATLQLCSGEVLLTDIAKDFKRSTRPYPLAQ